MESALRPYAETIYRAIARQFPVCCVSDEFYFFPQVMADGMERWGWDDFSPARVTGFAAEVRSWDRHLGQLQKGPCPDEERLEAALLRRLLQTLLEQLLEVAPQRRQPTFHLNIVAAGLTEALESGDPEAWARRLAGLPAFLEQAATLLDQVPGSSLEVGRHMLSDLRLWLTGLGQEGHATAAAVTCLDRFGAALALLPGEGPFHLPETLFERLVATHLGCGGTVAAIEQELREEYTEMSAVLDAEAERLGPGLGWRQLAGRVPFVPAPGNDLLALYRPELLRLEAHARRVGLVPERAAGSLQPDLAEVPPAMLAVRASDAYSARVGHPARGGVFFVYRPAGSRSGQVGRSLEYRMTAAHETWPGHHLLDVCRWSLTRPLRRPHEAPLFYEGWACFAEEVMAITGYFDGPWDRFLLARRRIERAARGLVDLGVQTGRWSFAEAARLLVEVGFAPDHAAEVVPKYALRPGYQVCYTLGLRRMLRLYARCSADGIGAFARQVLAQGEIGFAELQDLLLPTGD